MSRRKAAWAGGVALLVLVVAYVLSRRAGGAAPLAPATATPVPLVEPVVEEPATVTQETPVPEGAVPEPTTAPPRVVPPRSWGGGRAVAARTPPAPAEAAAAQTVEQPLPTWVRLSIVAAALLAFFAVSLIATKHV